ncbi:unnamed protein product [Heligmosomoides polygyrus]|uniref:Reverse transcriptase domain-containing protein n=1 Tax=Heligmosomoides polygyrus TaxID=6339 RepID=A0A183G4T2_HELPZ|nr:unnamed protein product [Heligmosomoides polygyrus]
MVVQRKTATAVMVVLDVSRNTDGERILEYADSHDFTVVNTKFQNRLPTVTIVDETWKDATDAITRAARFDLGTTKPGRRWVDKQASLCSDDKITVSETEAAPRKMKSGKASSDDLPVDLWKLKGWCPFDWLMEFFNQRVVDRRIRDVVEFSTNQRGFVSGCGTVDAIHAVRLLLEKHCERQKQVAPKSPRRAFSISEPIEVQPVDDGKESTNDAS